MSNSMAINDPRHILLACIFLASKVEEEVRIRFTCYSPLLHFGVIAHSS